MKPITITAPTRDEALQNAKRLYGDDWYVVSTKQVLDKTPFRDPLFEIVILRGKTAQDEQVVPKKDLDLPKPDDAVLLSLSQAVQEINKIQNIQEPPKKQEQNNQVMPDANMADLKAVKTEIAKLADKIKLMQNAVWQKTSPLRNELNIPPEFSEIYRIAKKSEMAQDLLDEIMTLTLKRLPFKMRESSLTIKNFFKVLLREMIPIRPEFKLVKPDKKILMLVGPTGVGKTTTLAKLATKFAIKEGYKVGVITLDSYKAGAFEQVQVYTRIMKIPIEKVEDPNDFGAALNILKHCDYILIDTAGCSQHDEEKLSKIKQFLDAESHTSIDVTLCIASNAKLKDLREIYKNFGRLKIDSIIATKMDETSSFGNLFSLAYETKKPFTYFSSGQEPTEDFKVATSDYFINCLLEGFTKRTK